MLSPHEKQKNISFAKLIIFFKCVLTNKIFSLFLKNKSTTKNE